MEQLVGKCAIVLGASERGNMGQAIARRFRAEGAEVMVASRNEAALAEFAEEIGGHFFCCDITNQADLKGLAKATSEKLGGVDIAVNSTGIALGGPFLEFDEDDLDRVIALQFKGPFFFLQAMVEQMLGTGGSIIQISSAVAQKSTTVDGGYEAYMGTKAGVDQIVHALANQFGTKGIRINSIAAGHTDTPMHHSHFDGTDIPEWMKAAFRESYPLGRYGTSDDIAEACVWLGRHECFITGEILQVNGGLTLRRNPLKADLARHERESKGSDS